MWGYPYLGDFPTNKTIFIPFSTYNITNGASITMTGLATSSVKIYKDASMTERTSTSGIALVDTDGIDIDSRTGIHGITIDTSDNADAGFYAAGSDYTVVIAGITVNAQTVNVLAGRFSIKNRSALMPAIAGRDLAVDASNAATTTDTANVTAIKAKTDSLTFTSAGKVDANVKQINDVTITGNGSGTPFTV